MNQSMTHTQIGIKMENESLTKKEKENLMAVINPSVGLDDEEIKILVDEIERLKFYDGEKDNYREVASVKSSVEGLVRAQIEALVEKNQRLEDRVAEMRAERSKADRTIFELRGIIEQEDQAREIDRLRQQIAEFAQERVNFTRTIFELRGIIERREEANRGQTYEIGNLLDRGYNQAGRITELEEQIGAYRNYGVDQAEEVTRLRETLLFIKKKSTSGIPLKLNETLDEIYNRAHKALAGAKGAEDGREAISDNTGESHGNTQTLESDRSGGGRVIDGEHRWDTDSTTTNTLILSDDVNS